MPRLAWGFSDGFPVDDASSASCHLPRSSRRSASNGLKRDAGSFAPQSFEWVKREAVSHTLSSRRGALESSSSTRKWSVEHRRCYSAVSRIQFAGGEIDMFRVCEMTVNGVFLADWAPRSQRCEIDPTHGADWPSISFRPLAPTTVTCPSSAQASRANSSALTHNLADGSDSFQ